MCHIFVEDKLSGSLGGHPIVLCCCQVKRRCFGTVNTIHKTMDIHQHLVLDQGADIIINLVIKDHSEHNDATTSEQLYKSVRTRTMTFLTVNYEIKKEHFRFINLFISTECIV